MGHQPGAGQARNRLLRAVGLTVALAAVAFCVVTLVDQWGRVSAAIRRADVGLLALALLASGLAMLGLALLWWACLRRAGAALRPLAVVAWYFGGELGKYLPGSVWSVLGRGELAARSGAVGRRDAYLTTLAAYAVMALAAGFACGLLGPAAALDGGAPAFWLLAVLVPLGLLSGAPPALRAAAALTTRVTRGRITWTPPSWAQLVRLVLGAVPTWLLVGGAAVAVTAALHLDQRPMQVALAAVVAWIVGFLAVPVPAGAGVREVLFVAICGLDAGPATAVAAIARILLVAVDAAGGVLGLAYSGRRRPAVAEQP
ncbi:MAG TPA: lysylphosphatidylglycerol synthase domain-containing protein [Jatrophihabitans sp.]|uniref:lysylphosphatidylglycerol synthase domain-containing protein n=1 Tax=Jatrophihabitans sp. TaxID=1932789 RepID=UPI002E01BA18|nr:lysylphosphatidylglycerol synthase domain-containing protein [Jatrophihabitans sp.]